MRLAKFLAHAGVASRRASERIIAAGRVTVGGAVVTDPAHPVADGDAVALDGSPVSAEPREVWALNKPAGVISTASEPSSRRAVVELVDSSARLYPVGRLDADSTGLILLTNDGELANLLTHPRYGVEKTYLADLRRTPSERELGRLRGGVRLDDGAVTAPARVSRAGARRVKLTIREGRNRQVRRMFEALGNEVISLARIRLGPVELGRLEPGESRRLGEDEVARLWEDARP